MVKQSEIPNHLIETAMALAAEQGWHELCLAEIAEAAKVPLVKAYQVYPSKQAILQALSRRTDAEVLADEALVAEWDEGDTSARDRLFDVMMRRYDALQPYRIALGNIILDQPRDPLAAACSAAQLLRSMSAMLEAARIPSSGVTGALRAKGLMAIHLATLRVWLRDDSADMAKTMAALDGYLRRVESLLRGSRLRNEPAGEAAD